jgi:P-type Cu+ transporter
MSDQKNHNQDHMAQATTDVLKDPVCGMTVTEESKYYEEFKGKTYFFCSDKCQSKFHSSPVQYIAKPATTTADAHTQHHQTTQSVNDASTTGTTIYTCPMHPEIRQDHPGNCPKCGMTLEPLIPELEEDENPELRDFRRRFWWTLPLTIVVTFLAMFGHQLNLFDMAVQSWILE